MKSSDRLLLSMSTEEIKEVIYDVLTKFEAQKGGSTLAEIIDVKGASELTGYTVHTIYKLTSQRKLPFYHSAHDGRKVYFKRSELERWMTSQRVETSEEFRASNEGEFYCRKKHTNKYALSGKSKENKVKGSI